MFDRLHISYDKQHINRLSIIFDRKTIGGAMNGEQIRAARTLLGWTASDLAKESGVSYPTVQRLDATKGAVSGRYDTIEKIRNTLAENGIQFLENGDVAAGPGVALSSSIQRGT